MINESLNLIDKERKMKQNTIGTQQQRRCREFRQLQSKVWDPGGLLLTLEHT